jgi:hypothetical protein
MLAGTSTIGFTAPGTRLERENQHSSFKIGASDAQFFEKQSQQVIENSRTRPKTGQNNPNFGHFWGGGRFGAKGWAIETPL